MLKRIDWYSKMPCAVHEVLLHDLKPGVLCAVRIFRITRALFFRETVDDP
jgi:hypothetical protein